MARMIPLYSVSSQAEIRCRAEEVFEAAGRPGERDLDHWLQAEADYREFLRLGLSRPRFNNATTILPFPG